MIPAAGENRILAAKRHVLSPQFIIAARFAQQIIVLIRILFRLFVAPVARRRFIEQKRENNK
jgi:hypothetical protein